MNFLRKGTNRTYICIFTICALAQAIRAIAQIVYLLCSNKDDSLYYYAASLLLLHNTTIINTH